MGLRPASRSRPPLDRDHEGKPAPPVVPSFAYVLVETLQRIGLAHTKLTNATCGSIRLKLLKIGARVTVSVRRIKIAIASACPFQSEFALAHARLRAPPAQA